MGRGVAAVSLLVVLLATSCAGGTGLDRSSPAQGALSPTLTAKPAAALFWVEAPIAGDPTPIRAHVPNTGAVVEAGGGVQLLPPPIVPGPRRVAIQAGHWKTEEAPDEFPNLPFQLGSSVAGINEVDVNLDIADRVAVILRANGIIVDVLPATIPPSYVADAFVALHADDDGYGSATGFKIAHGFYRGPFEDALVDALTREYAAATALPLNDQITDDMTDYYAFAWFRYEHALAPHTPAAIIEMGYLSNRGDRALLTDEPGVVAQGIANGVLRFLGANSREALFANAIVVPTVAAPGP